MHAFDKPWWCLAALSGALVVMMGAYAAHGMEAKFGPNMISAVETAVRYQAWHTLAMLIILVWRSSVVCQGQQIVLLLWALGVVAFSGSLYIMALGGVNLGIVTPIGGILLIGGWLMLAVVVLIRRTG